MEKLTDGISREILECFLTYLHVIHDYILSESQSFLISKKHLEHLEILHSELR